MNTASAPIFQRVDSGIEVFLPSERERTAMISHEEIDTLVDQLMADENGIRHLIRDLGTELSPTTLRPVVEVILAHHARVFEDLNPATPLRSID
ncbi:MAG: hypothetical protein Q8Q20_01185 [bacterium]|nr:hypothetical protein [bacterium]